MRYLILLALLLQLLLPGVVQGNETNYSPKAVRELNLTFRKHYNRQDFFLDDYSLIGYQGYYEHQPEYWSYGLELELDLTLATSKYIDVYWDQNIVGDSTNKQYRRVHWEFEIGFAVQEKVSIFHYHRSEHVLDIAKERYPLYDYHGLRVCFIGPGCKK